MNKNESDQARINVKNWDGLVDEHTNLSVPIAINLFHNDI